MTLRKRVVAVQKVPPKADRLRFDSHRKVWLSLFSIASIFVLVAQWIERVVPVHKAAGPIPAEDTFQELKYVLALIKTKACHSQRKKVCRNPKPRNANNNTAEMS